MQWRLNIDSDETTLGSSPNKVTFLDLSESSFRIKKIRSSALLPVNNYTYSESIIMYTTEKLNDVNLKSISNKVTSKN